ncbi:MAG: HDIG domain-containing protein, partial [bacterium]|nr:HDIG domain-containing protein [bacterium]
GIVLYTLSGGAAAILTVRRIRNRSQYLKTVLYVIITYTAVLYIIGMMRFIQVSDISWTVLKFGLPNAIFSPLITLGFIALFEIVFGVATDMTLLELSDQNRPLLRDLAIKAPGTYHHSIVIGNLSESAAEAIGANSLLARVGCYYHDIGKTVKPEYFIENQPDSMKKHEALAPSMSSLIISSHVREGIEIADKFKLPEVIKDFIMQHHGTGKISFFYEKAIEKSGDKNINPADYSYPGPKPLTKETGIVMLADSVEAATRALKDPSPSRIKERVNSVIEKRFREGQLDSCELTFKDLRQIADRFIKILTGMFHVRLEYPDEDNNQKSGKSISTQEKIIEKPD